MIADSIWMSLPVVGLAMVKAQCTVGAVVHGADCVLCKDCNSGIPDVFLIPNPGIGKAQIPGFQD